MSDDKLQEHLLTEERRLLSLETDIKALTAKVSSLETSVSDLVSAWRTANNLVGFVKWVAGIATSVIAIIALLKLGKG